MESVSIELRNVTKKFGDDVTAVDDVSLTIEPGHLVTLLGPSGSGKTTLLRAIAGFEDVTSGEILVAGDPMENVPTHRRRLGMVAQDYALFPHMTVAENLRFGITSSRRARRERTRLTSMQMKERIGSTLEIVGLGGYGERRTQQLSGGQRQRVALARALVTDPQVLLLDEPFAALDKHLREQLQLEVRRVQQQVGITTVFVTHDQGEALSMSDRIAVLSNGRVEQYGTPGAVYDQPETAFVAGFVGRVNIVPGEVISAAGGLVQVQAAGTRIEARSERDLAAGTAVSVSVRPERMSVRLTDEPTDGANSISGVVANCVYFGDRLDVIVDTAAGPMVVNVIRGDSFDRGVEPGTSVELVFSTAATNLLPVS